MHQFNSWKQRVLCLSCLFVVCKTEALCFCTLSLISYFSPSRLSRILLWYMVLTTLISAHDERFWSNRFTCTGCKRPIQGGCEYSLVSTRGFKVKSEEERGNWESPNICNWVNEYSCRLCEEVETTYLSLSKRAFFGTRPRVLLRSLYPIYMSCCAEEEKVYPCHARRMTAWVGMLWGSGAMIGDSEVPKHEVSE